MHSDKKDETILTPKSFNDAMIRLGLLVFLVFLSMRVLSPFITVLVWGMILAIMLYPLHQYMTRRLKSSQGFTALFLVIFSFILIGIPLITMGDSLSSKIYDLQTAYQDKTLTITKPDLSIKKWPLVGEKLYDGWYEAATDLPVFLDTHKDQIRILVQKAIALARSTLFALIQFIGALIIAGIMMAWAQKGSDAMQRILNRIVGPIRGVKLQHLTVSTVRSVATGVLGVAYIQGLLFGIGFFIAGVPAAGILALIVMLVGIIQLPTAIIAIPIVIYVWSTGDNSLVENTLYTIYFIIAGLSDNVLKPLLLGRGVDAPMPIILIGALGGMVVSGLIGMFLGAVLLTIAYQIFWYWIDDADESSIDAVE